MAAVDEGLRDQVRDRYARAALTVTEVGATADCCGGGGCGPTVLDEAGEAHICSERRFDPKEVYK